MLIFDLDGTLIDSNGVWLEVDKTFLARRNAPYTQEYYEGVAHSILQNCAVFTKEYLRLEESCEEIIAEWMELAEGAYHNVPLKPHVRAYLDRCREAGHRMAVFTACVPEHCQAAMAQHQLGVKPRECVLFDDSLAACKGAKAAGMTVVGIRDSFFRGTEADMRELCDRYIESFGDLL